MSLSGAKPAAIAPDETSATSAPRSLRDAITLRILSPAAEACRDPAAPDRDEEPV